MERRDGSGGTTNSKHIMMTKEPSFFFPNSPDQCFLTRVPQECQSYKMLRKKWGCLINDWENASSWRFLLPLCNLKALKSPAVKEQFLFALTASPRFT